MGHHPDLRPPGEIRAGFAFSDRSSALTLTPRHMRASSPSERAASDQTTHKGSQMATPKKQTFSSGKAAVANARKLQSRGDISKADLRRVEQGAKKKK
jgi:hypothetical protein